MLEQLRDHTAEVSAHTAVAYHGLRAALLERRLDRNEGAIDRLDHEQAFFQALGNVATSVVVNEGRLNPDLPPKPPVRSAATGKHAFSAQAQYHSMSRVYRQYGVANTRDAVRFDVDPSSGRVVQIPDHDLPLEERRQREKQMPSLTREDMQDPRSPGSLIIPLTRKERSAERRAAKEIDKIRQGRMAQATRRRMLGRTGPNHFWRTKLRHLGERLDDNQDLRNGTASAFELRDRARERGGQMDHGEWRQLRETASSLGQTGENLTGSIGAAERHATKKQNRKINKNTKLQAKLAQRHAKQAAARARI